MEKETAKTENKKKTPVQKKKTSFSKKPGGRRNKSFKREKPDFEQKLLGIRRVTRVMAGGRRFSFSVVMVVGDKKGSVGVGLGKSSDTSLAIGKAVKSGQANMVKLPLNEEKSIPHEVTAKYCGSKIMLMPNKERGLVAGGAVRDVLELAGVTNVTTKIISRSKNPINNARATVQALMQMRKIQSADTLATPEDTEKTDAAKEKELEESKS